ncbi:hypothetical protein GCM10009753_58530 [Streptantibioticus ferralitis]
MCAAFELPKKLTCLLGGPGGGRVGGHAEDVHGSGADLQDEQRVEALQTDESMWKSPRGLSAAP